MSNMIIDPGKHKEKYLNWKSKIENSEIDGISKENSKLIKCEVLKNSYLFLRYKIIKNYPDNLFQKDFFSSLKAGPTTS